MRIIYTDKYRQPALPIAMSAGANRGTVRASEADGIVTVNTRRFADSPTRALIVHKGDAGSWHGCGRAVNARAVEVVDPITFERSASGGGDYAAMVVDIPDGGLYAVVSGYDGRREWEVLHITRDSVQRIPRSEWLAQHAPIE